MKKLIIPIYLLFLLLQGSYAFTIQRLGLEQGLSNNDIASITQDKQGVLWFATKWGLNRFDGCEFRIFRKSDGNTINFNELNVIYADQTDNLIWIATSRRGFNIFDENSGTFKDISQNSLEPYSPGHKGATDIKRDTKGNLWIAFYNGGVDYYDKQTHKFTNYNTANVKGLVSDMILSVCDDKKGQLYIANINDGLSILSVKDHVASNYRHSPIDPTSIPSNHVNCVFIDSYKNIWVGTNNGLALFNPIEKKFTTFQNISGNNHSISNNHITCIDETADKRLLVGTMYGGLNILDLENFYYSMFMGQINFKQISAGNLSNQLSHPNVACVFHDSFNNIWIGTNGGGINFIPNKNQYFNTYSYNPVVGNSNSLSHPFAAGLCIDNENALWVATDGGGIDVFRNDAKINNYNHSSNQIVGNNLITTFNDSEGNLWFGTFDGKIIRYKRKSKVFEPITGFDCKELQIRSFFEDKDKNIWIASYTGLHVYNLLTHKTKSYTTFNSGITDNMLQTVSQDKEGNIWVGTFSGQICIFNSDFKRIRMISPIKKLYNVFQIYRDSKNRMWAATGENLFMFCSWDDKRYASFGLKDGMADNFIASIIEDNNGNLWFSTNTGISCLNPQTKTVRNYNHFDGVPLGRFMVNSVAKTKDGIIYFGSDNGVCYFDTRKQMNVNNLPPIAITDVEISNIEDGFSGKTLHLPLNKEINLNYNQNTFSISFNVLDYSYNNQIEFCYMLEGLQDSWYNINTTKQVTFRNLPHGSYTFHLKYRYKNQNWSNKATLLPIIIRPPFWLSWWAKTIYGIVVLMIIVYFFRFYTLRLQLENSLYLEKQKGLQQQELNTERLKFYTNITHELRTPLTLILGPLEDLINEGNIQDIYQKKIKNIHKSAVRLLDLINQILEFRKTETQNRKLYVQRADLSNHIREISLKYKELNRNQNLKIKYSIQEGYYELMYDPEVVTIILDNLISNAIKYTPTGEVMLSLYKIVENEISYTVIKVIDSGYGIEANSLSRIFDRYYQVNSIYQASGSGIGLSIVKNLVKLHEANISVESQHGQGTTFCIKLLTNNTYPNALHTEAKVECQAFDEKANTKPIMLIVEDNLDISNYVSETFTDDFDILTAENGLQGMELAFSNIPDIIISDIMMPVMDGTEFCKRVKEDLRTSHIPFILLTAKDTIPDKTEGYIVGADSYITKPFSGSLLKSRVVNILEARKKLATLFGGSFTQKQEDEQMKINPIDNEFIKKITAFVEEHLEDEDINIGNIAVMVYMSYSTLYRKIKALTGLSTNEFIRKIRMQNAYKLLTTHKYGISEVMYMVGISSSTYFRKCFKEEFSLSPMEYVKTLKNVKKLEL